MNQTQGIVAISVLAGLLVFFLGFYLYYSIWRKIPCPCWYVQMCTWAFDFSFWYWALYLMDELVRGLDHSDGIFNGTDDLLAQIWDACRAACISPLTIGCACFREWLMYKALGHRVAKAKRDRRWTWNDLKWIFLVFAVAVPGIFAQSMLGFFEWEEILIDWRSYYKVCVEYWFMSWAKDLLVMNTMHTYAHKEEHKDGWLAWGHGLHHSNKDNCDAIALYKFNPIDLVLENVCGPCVLLTIKAIIFRGELAKIKIHLGAYLMLSIHEIAVHSCNPYSVLTFCPIFDLIFLGNITHQLHHADIHPTGWNGIWPVHHIFYNKRQADIDLYNKHFGTEFKFEEYPCHKHAHNRASSIVRRSSSIGGKRDVVVEEKREEKYKHNDEINKDVRNIVQATEV